MRKFLFLLTAAAMLLPFLPVSPLQALTRAAGVEPQAQTSPTVSAITPAVPIVVSTPDADGAIVHVVQYGQTLIEIAEAYQVSLDELRSLNRISGSEIFVGDTLIIRLAPTATATVPVTPSATVTRTPRPTRTPVPVKPTATSTREVIATAVPTEEPSGGLGSSGSMFSDPLLIGIVALAGIGLAFMAAGSILRRK